MQQGIGDLNTSYFNALHSGIRNLAVGLLQGVLGGIDGSLVTTGSGGDRAGGTHGEYGSSRRSERQRRCASSGGNAGEERHGGL